MPNVKCGSHFLSKTPPLAVDHVADDGKHQLQHHERTYIYIYTHIYIYQMGVAGYMNFMFWAKPGFPRKNLVIFNNFLFYRFLSL